MYANLPHPHNGYAHNCKNHHNSPYVYRMLSNLSSSSKPRKTASPICRNRKKQHLRFPSIPQEKQRKLTTYSLQKHHNLYFPIYSEKRQNAILHTPKKPSFQYILALEEKLFFLILYIYKRQNFLYCLNPVEIPNSQSPYNFRKHNHLSLSGYWERQRNAVFGIHRTKPVLYRSLYQEARLLSTVRH